MTNKEIIQALKNNRYPFGMWDKPECYGTELGGAMQAKAKEIGKFDIWTGNGTHGYSGETAIGRFNPAFTYRLRPDYEEKPEIVEWPIFQKDGELRYARHLADHDEQGHSLVLAMTKPDSIGFKYEDVLFGGLYKRKSTGQFALMIDFAELHLYEVCDMTEAHVLFQVTK